MITNVGATCPHCCELTVVLTVEGLYGRFHVEVARQDCACDLTDDDIDTMFEEAKEYA